MSPQAAARCRSPSQTAGPIGTPSIGPLTGSPTIGGGLTGIRSGLSAAHRSKDQIRGRALALTARSSGCRCPSRFLESSVRVAASLSNDPRDSPSLGQWVRLGCHRPLREVG